MECPSCRSVIKAEHENKLDSCPICGRPLPHNAKKQTKESFYFVWGTMHEDTLKKHKGPFDQKTAQLALENYLKAVDENPKYAVETASFLEAWPIESPLLKTIEKPGSIFSLDVFEKLEPAKKAAVYLYGKGLMDNNPQSGLRLLKLLKDNLSADDFQSAVRALYNAFSGSEVLSHPAPENLALKAAFHAALEEYTQAVDNLCKAISSQNESIEIMNSEIMEMYTGIPANLENRISYIHRELEAGHLKNAFNGIYRPVSNDCKEFDHQRAVFDQAAQAIQTDFETWKSITREWLNRKIMLRGIHLFSQQLVNAKPELKDKVQDLLDLHYEKVYMQPFAWIENTDKAICANMLD